MVNVKEDLRGKTFGRLTVVRQVEDYVSPNGKHDARWLCKCSCEEDKYIEVNGNSLKKKNGTRSCGCIGKEKISIRNKDGHLNKYDLSGEYGVGWTPKGEEFWFDKEDYDLIKDYCWNYDISTGYLETTNKIKFHRLVMNVNDSNIFIDHITHPPRNENKKDNRKSNLRITNRFQNNVNKSIAQNNTSGATGVTWSKLHKKWIARIGFKDKRIYLGIFQNFDDAVKARRIAEIKYYGEYRYNANN